MTLRRRTLTTALSAALTVTAAAGTAGPAHARGARPDNAGSGRRGPGTGRPGGGPPPGSEGGQPLDGDRPPQLLMDGTGLYPRVIRLAHQGEADDRLLASVVSFDGSSGFGVKPGRSLPVSSK